MRTLALSVVGMLALSGCVSVNLPDVPPYHPGHAQAETGALAPPPPVLNLGLAPATAAPDLPVPGGGHENHGAMKSMPEDQTGGPMHGSAAQPSQEPTPNAEVNDAEKTQYTCPMHPEVVSGSPGTCPKCGMALVRKQAQ